MKTVPHKRHRHSEGPGHYKWVIVALVAVGLLHLSYRMAGDYFDSLGGALLTIWLLLPAFGGAKVGAGGVIQGGLPAFIGTLFLIANYWAPLVGYVGWEQPLSVIILLMVPVIHWVVVLVVSVALKALTKR